MYGYPIEEAAKIAVREVKNYLTQRRREAEIAEGEDACPHAPQSGRARTPAAPPMEVIFCCFSAHDAAVYELLPK